MRYILDILIWFRTSICYFILKHILGWQLGRPKKIYNEYKNSNYIIIYPYTSIYEIIISLLFIYSCNLSLTYIYNKKAYRFFKYIGIYNSDYITKNNKSIYYFLEHNISQEQYNIIKKKDLNVISILIDFNNNIIDIREIANNITIHTLNYKEIYNKINDTNINLIYLINIEECKKNSFINIKKTKIYNILILIILIYIFMI